MKKIQKESLSKNELRQIIAEKRKKLTPEYKRQASKIICSKVINSPDFQKATTVFIYISLPWEPDTREVLERAWFLGKKVCVPKCLDDHHMAAVPIRCYQDLIPGMMNIPEPVNCAITIPAQDIDLAIVPCISASPDGRRLGHGAGFYDYFMSGQKMTKLCICFEKLVSDQIPMDAYDQWMDQVITD